MKQCWLRLTYCFVLTLWTFSFVQAAPPLITHGITSGEVTATSANIWTRTDQATEVLVEYAQTATLQPIKGASTIVVSAEQDFTGVVSLTGLQPATRYYYRVRPRTAAASTGIIGSFVTAPAQEQPHDVTFLWGGDLGGQGVCRQPVYTIFNAMDALAADFFLFGGDTIYADSRCPSPPNEPGADFVSRTQKQFWAKYRYQREDDALRRLFVSTSVYAIWDDHEVKNDFAGPTQPLTPVGLNAFGDYFPFTRAPRESHQLYRSFRWGSRLELFILDNRQYRTPNAEPDGPEKTMLGAAQLKWLLDGLTSSTATWQVIMSSVPLSARTGNPRTGHDSWAKGSFPGGFDTELEKIVATLRTQQKRNVVWLSTDIHVARSLSYDPDQDGVADFHEFISGPLSAITGDLDPLDETFHPRILYEETHFFNFGVVRIEGKTGTLTVEIRDQEGSKHYTLTLPAR
jgi:alkaline phosphatase D